MMNYSHSPGAASRSWGTGRAGLRLPFASSVSLEPLPCQRICLGHPARHRFQVIQHREPGEVLEGFNPSPAAKHRTFPCWKRQQLPNFPCRPPTLDAARSKKKKTTPKTPLHNHKSAHKTPKIQQLWSSRNCLKPEAQSGQPSALQPPRGAFLL